MKGWTLVVMRRVMKRRGGGGEVMKGRVVTIREGVAARKDEES